MKKSICLLMVFCALLMIQNCVGPSTQSTHDRAKGSSEDQRALDMAAYKPYLDKNTVEGYRVFISRYPENLFVADARRRIDTLIFAAYEKTNTLESYRDFISKYPHSPHVKDAKRKINTIEYRNCQKKDTVDAYRAFIEKHPDCYYTADAKLWIQEYEFKRLNARLVKAYGFDLLMYRLALRRIKRKLILDNKTNLGAYDVSADMGVYEGKKYFVTHLVYEKGALSHVAIDGRNDPDAFDTVISAALVHLQKNFRRKKAINGFAFTLSASSEGLYEPHAPRTEYYFDKNAVARFARRSTTKNELFSQCLTTRVAGKKPPKKAHAAAVAPAPPGMDIGLDATTGTFTNAILLMWRPGPSSREYQVYRSVNMNDGYSPVSGKRKGTLYYDTGVAPGQSYFYKIRGFTRRKGKGWFSRPVQAHADAKGISGPVIVQGTPVSSGVYVAKPKQRESPIYDFRKNGTCMERTHQLRLDGKWFYEKDTLVVKAGLFDHHYTFDLTERWDNAFTTHGGVRFHRMGLKQVKPSRGEMLRFSGKGYIHAVGTGFAETNDDYQLEITVALERTGKWQVEYALGGKTVKKLNTPVAVPKSQELEIVAYKGQYFLSMPASGPGYFRQ